VGAAFWGEVSSPADQLCQEWMACWRAHLQALAPVLFLVPDILHPSPPWSSPVNEIPLLPSLPQANHACAKTIVTWNRSETEYNHMSRMHTHHKNDDRRRMIHVCCTHMHIYKDHKEWMHIYFQQHKKMIMLTDDTKKLVCNL
jgi:hypothetical protein